MPVLEPASRRATAVLAVTALGFIAYLCTFKILDRDFWWHIKAGEMMWNNRSLIRIEPFAYTREGQPYLATYEWLAQSVLYFIYRFWGVTGILGLRMAAMAGLLFPILWMNRKNLLTTGFIAIMAANAVQPFMIERPQLFTFLFFSSFILLIFRALDGTFEKKTAIALVLLQILWVNFHGAACLLGVGLLGALFCQQFMDWVGASGSSKASSREILYLFLTGIGLLAALLISPVGFHNFTYLFSLLDDKTILFIGEWQAREPRLYWRETGFFWALALFSLLAVRRKMIFCALLLAFTGFLSLKAFRHEVFFVCAASLTSAYQLKHSPGYQKAAAWIKRKTILAFLSSLVVFLGLGFYTRFHHAAFVQRDHLDGLGIFDLAKGAYEFIEKENVQGKMFNTYGIGGYLIYRGYPKRPVYIDGRNVDYGFDFMNKTYAAGTDPKVFKELEDKYQFTYALVDYDNAREKDFFYYTSYLNTAPDWALVYVDDWVAVYLKDTPRNRSVIERLKYRAVTPEVLEWGVPQMVRLRSPQSEPVDQAKLEEELKRAVRDNPQGVKAGFRLAEIYLKDRRLAEAEALLKEARKAQPHRPKIDELWATIYVLRKDWKNAAQSYERMLFWAGKAYPNVNYSYIADVMEKAGNPFKAKVYRLRAGKGMFT